MEKQSGAFPSILKKPKKPPEVDRAKSLIDKSNKIRSNEKKKKEVKDKKKKVEDEKEPLPQGCTPLMYACQQGDYKSLVEIIKSDPGAVLRRDRGLRCALHYCAEGGPGGAARVACADRLLMEAPSLGVAKDADGLTPLHLAVIQGNVPLVQLLLAAGADVHARDDEEHTVVHWATVCGEVGALRAVLAAGADVATPDQHGGYPLHYAAQMCGAPATVDHQGRGTALEVLRALVREGGARADVRDSDGRSPLLWAASAGSAAAVLALVKAGARVDDADRDGLTALHCAASRGHTECIETLLSLCGAKTDAADSNGCTALHYAVTLGHADATALLLQHGADAHRQDRKGRSPAHCGAAKGQLETVRMLGARGANLWLRNSKGDLPLHEAVASGRRDLVKWLLDGRPSQVNATNHDGRTPLHVAAATDNADLCRLLLDRGADVNPIARSSRDDPLTPLDCATSRGYRSTAKYLQMHGGLPASKLSNTQIIIDDGPISGLPTRRVTSTRIDVRDRIRIEKREVVEVPSAGISESRRRYRRDDSTEHSSSDEALDFADRSSKFKCGGNIARGRRRRHLNESQKSFSDGHDSDHGGRRRRDHQRSDSEETVNKRGVKKSRSRSEPCSKRHERVSSLHRGRHRHYSDSNNSSVSDHRREKKKSKRHRKRSKRKTSSLSESTSSESSDRRSTKKKGKKTSIHIEDDENKQTVNIVNFKKTDSTQTSARNEEKEDEVEADQVENSPKGKTNSETETDTTSLKTSTVVTEAQVHVDRVASVQNNEITVTVDAENNLLVETPTIKITQQTKEIEETVKDNTTDKGHDDTHHITENGPPAEDNKNEAVTVDSELIKQEIIASTMTAPIEANKVVLQIDNIPEQVETNENITLGDSASGKGTNEAARKRSFEVIAEPDKPNASLVPEADDKSTLEGAIGPEIVKETAKSTGKIETGITRLHGSPLHISTSFTKLDEESESKDVKKAVDNVMGEVINNGISTQEILEDVPPIIDSMNDSNNERNINILKTNRQDFASTTQSSGDLTQSGDIRVGEDKGLVTVIDSNVTDTDRAVQQVLMESSQDETQLQLNYSSPKRVRKSSKDSQRSSRKSSLYETESYKVLSDINSANETTIGILKKSNEKIDESFLDDDKLIKDTSYSRVPSVSDNEMYGGTETNGKRKRFRKKVKSRGTVRSKSENSERGYESSGLMDSGFEPSPRIVQRTRVMSPRLSAYYQQRNASGKYSGRSDSRIPVRKPGDKYAVDMKSVTQKIQTNMRRYYCERKIFQHLLELKRLQIRSSKANEAVFVKRAIDEYNASSLSTVGNGPYNNPDYTFSSFEKFLYDSLRKLQKSGKKHLDKLPEKQTDFDYGESELYKMSAIPDNPCLCTTKTHRCFHAVHAYTGVPCSAYIPYKLNHHTMPKPSSSRSNFLPKIDSKSAKSHVTLEVSHGSERQLISLPSEKLDKNKRYYVTFTVKGSNPTSDNDNPTKPSENAQRKSV